MAEVSEYYPERWDWKPFSRPVTIGVVYRMAATTDIPALRLLFAHHGSRRPKAERFKFWLENAGYNVWLAVRNWFHPVAALCCRHTNDLNEIVAYAFNPIYVDRYKIRVCLLHLVQYELPECPTTIRVPGHDETTQAALLSLGMKAEKADDHWIFRLPAVATFRQPELDDLRPEAGAQDPA